MSKIISHGAARVLAGSLAFSLCFPVGGAPISGLSIPNCPAAGYSVYYVNGIDNDNQDAVISAMALSTIALPKAVDTSILAQTTIHTIYNPTDGKMLDLIESAGQAITGTVSNYTAYLTAAFVAVFGGLALPIPGLDGVLTKFVDAFRASVTKTLSSTDVLKVVNDAVPRIVADLNAGKVVVMAAHSQGNLYANEIYDRLSQSVTPAQLSLFKVVNVAPPTPRHVSNIYVLNSTDIIVPASLSLPTFVGDKVLDYSTPFDFNKAVFNDAIGHNFVDVYLSTVPGSGNTLQNETVTALQQAFTGGLAGALESCPSPGGFSNVNLTCTPNADGTNHITGLYSVNLAPGEQITTTTWSGQYLVGSTGNCQNPTYNPPANQTVRDGEYVNASCIPTAGLQINPTSFANCYNPLNGTARNIWVTVDGNYSKDTGGTLMLFCRVTTINLNGAPVPNARPGVSIDTMLPCS